jgi:hypothetical protein
LRHFASTRFWEAYEALPGEVRTLARKSFLLLKQNPRHPSLYLKRIGSIWSVRVGIHYRALGVDVQGDIQWFWIGTHAEYDALIG